MENIDWFGGISAAVFVYLVATTSPGPANIAIMTTAMHSGRRSGLLLASGVISGSLFWGLVAASGLSVLIATYSGLTASIMVLGGLYFAFLAYRALRSFRRAVTGDGASQIVNQRPDRSLYFEGLAIHLSNPKSVFAWAATITIVLVPGSAPLLPFVVMFGCWLAGVVIFCGYAILFSSPSMIAWYKRHSRWVDLGSGTLFALFSVQLIMSGYQAFMMGL